MLGAVPRLREASLHLSADATPFLQIIQFLIGQALDATSSVVTGRSAGPDSGVGLGRRQRAAVAGWWPALAVIYGSLPLRSTSRRGLLTARNLRLHRGSVGLNPDV